MQPTPSSVIAPAWAVIPLAAIVVLWVIAYAWRLQTRDDMTSTRRRVRTINAVVMVLLAGAVAYGLTGVTTARPRAFVAAWTAAASLALIMAALAIIDSWHTAHLTVRGVNQLKREMRDARRSDSSPPTPPPPAPPDR